ncbi:MAG: ABC transporter substrate-binding protein [Candidatus Bathyarchaeia archaeon]
MLSNKTKVVVGVVIILIVIASAYAYSVNVPRQSAVKNSLVVEEAEQPDTLDPAVTYQTSGWEIVDQVYQGLVAPNGSSVTSYVGQLASDWSVSDDGMTYTFNLRHGVTFSNGDPFNAYVMWFSIYRTITVNQAPAWILTQNLAAGNGFTFNVTDRMLNSINYTDPSANDLAYMENPGQSVQVTDTYQLTIHLGYGTNGNSTYSAFLATLTTPMAMAVDPNVVIAQGGVIAGQPNSWMGINMMGTGFYTLGSWIQGQSVTLQKNISYWATSVSSSNLNYAIKPAILDTITIYYKPSSARVADISSGAAQIITATPADYTTLKTLTGVDTEVLPVEFGSAQNVFYIYMDQDAFPPFQDIRVRHAIAEAIDYQGLIKTVLGGLGVQWIGPVPAGFPYYNESIRGLTPYQYNPVDAADLLAKAGYVAHLPNGTVLNPNGKVFPAVNFLYNQESTIQSQVAPIVQTELGAIGIQITLSPLAFRQYASVVSSPATNSTQYPFGLNFYSEDYTASIDYVYALVTTGQVGTSAYSNETVTRWATQAATTLGQTVIVQNFQNITQAMYSSYTDVWLFVPFQVAVHQNGVTGMIPNPAGSGAAYFMYYNTVQYS